LPCTRLEKGPQEEFNVTRTTTLALCIFALAASGAAGGMAACSSSSNGGSSSGSSSGGAEASTDGPSGQGLVPEIACSDTIDSVYGDPGDVSSQAKGAILKCAHDVDMTAAQLYAATQVDTDGTNPPYQGKTLTSGAHIYRVLYRTERGNPGNTPGYSSALLLLPEKPRAGAGLPVVVAAHGTFGLAPGCAPSKNAADEPRSPTNAQFLQADYRHLLYPLVGLGYAVIAPDFAGYANWGGANNPPPTYDDAADIGKSVLDGARALRKVIPSSVSQQVVLVGHSEGGSAVLSALSIADAYGLDGVLSGVAAYAPLWISRRSWGALLSLPNLFPLATDRTGAISLWYHWAKSALYDGPDAAYELFQPAKVPDLQPFFTQDCWFSSFPDLTKNGEKSDNDYFDPAYAQAMTTALSPLFGTGSCGDGGAAAECQTWLDRMTADWPHLDGGAATVPVLVWYANNDPTIAPDYMQCAFNRLAADGVDAKFCYDPGPNMLNGQPSGHGVSVAHHADYVADWIAQLTLPDAGAPTEGCQVLPTNEAGAPQLTGADGGPVSCYSYIPTQ
jgi:pimeloyl-ACP methyl ester carboxylesterase